MIREFQTADTEQVMQIWLNGNEDAHPFISKKYCDCDKHKRVERYATTCRKAESDNYLLKISGSSRFRRNPQRG